MSRATVNVRLYSIVRRAVEEGAAVGIRRARKHTDDPSEETMVDAVSDEIMVAINEVVELGDDYEGEAEQ